jgi:hypothetical protein
VLILVFIGIQEAAVVQALLQLKRILRVMVELESKTTFSAPVISGAVAVVPLATTALQVMAVMVAVAVVLDGTDHADRAVQD